MNSTSNVYVWRKKTKHKKKHKTESIHIMLKIKKEEKENGPISTAVKAK